MKNAAFNEEQAANQLMSLHNQSGSTRRADDLLSLLLDSAESLRKEEMPCCSQETSVVEDTQPVGVLILGVCGWSNLLNPSLCLKPAFKDYS